MRIICSGLIFPGSILASASPTAAAAAAATNRGARPAGRPPIAGVHAGARRRPVENARAGGTTTIYYYRVCPSLFAA